MRRLAWVAILALGCKKPAPLELPAPVAALGELARPAGVTAEATVSGEQGGAVPLSDGAMLVVAAGAYGGGVHIRLDKVELDVGKLRPDVKGGVAYVVTTDRDVEQFKAPVTLQVKRPEGPLSAVVWDGTAWKPVAIPDGPVAAVSIAHFSRGIIGFVEWLRARTNATNEVIEGEDSVEAKKRARLLSHGNDAAKSFYGVGDKLDQVTPRQLCGELHNLVATFPKDAFAFPPGNDWRNAELGLWLIDGRIPSTTSDALWKMTEGTMEAVRAKVLASSGRLAPADMLKLCVETAGGNVPVGVMVCHNFLKEVTYAGREQPLDKMDPSYGEIAGKLMPLRTDDVAPSGYYDKMGPIYHVFAAMAAGVWSAHPGLGNAAAAGEALLRASQRGGDRPDPEKGAADDCGVDVGWAIRKHEAGDYRGGPLPPPPATPWKLHEPAPPAAPPPPPVARDAGPVDAGVAADGGASPESMLAQLDAGAAPADQRQTWDGAWKGKAKSTVHLDEVNTAVDEEIALDVKEQGDVVHMERKQGAQVLAMDLKKTPSNPNACVGQGDVHTVNAGADVNLHYHVAAFLHTDGRLYIAGRNTVTAEMPGPDGPVRSNMNLEFIAILSK